ncbi:hypothetical protein Taro_049030 [Colocasia esculenta]|uniref:Uncharacterized protein n=1 Tax=Colocasia esculenta TaxID=4460 RepID=A0A843X9P1_COLES|nr:hypothetical protein [Colocasia esculenta]
MAARRRAEVFLRSTPEARLGSADASRRTWTNREPGSPLSFGHFMTQDRPPLYKLQEVPPLLPAAEGIVVGRAPPKRPSAGWNTPRRPRAAAAEFSVLLLRDLTRFFLPGVDAVGAVLICFSCGWFLSKHWKFLTRRHGKL